MRLTSTVRGRSVATALATVAVAGAATAALVAQGASGGSLPANPPTDASAAGLTVINRTVSPAPTSNRGFDGFQTYTVNAPAGKTVLQGFATLSGGLTGSVVILSTQATPAKYVVKLKFPGEQGRAGKLYVRVQLVPKS